MIDEHSISLKALRSSGGTVVRISGDVDLNQAPALHTALLEICEEQPRRLVINLSDVPYMDSSGVGTLVGAFRKVKAYGGAMFLVAPNSRVRSVFEITQLDRFFTILATEQEALKT